MNRVIIIGLLFGLLPALSRATDDPTGMSAYREANFSVALPLLRDAAAKAPTDVLIQAAFLSTLVNSDLVDEALDTDRRVASLPDSAELTAARGEFAFYMANMPEAEKLFRAGTKMNGNAGRAYFGLFQVFHAASYYRTGRLFCLKAHELAPDDAVITRTWLRYLMPEKRKELLGPFMESHPWLYKRVKEHEETAAAISENIGKNPIFETEGGPQETTLKFFVTMRDAQHPTGVGLDFRIGDGKPLRMLFDTGASGITVKQSAVDKAGLDHLGSQVHWGIGDKGVRNGFAAVAETCQVGSLKFKNCVFGAMEGRSIGEEDGLIGADFFQDYLVTIDFQQRLLHLKPLPPRPVSPQGYDRVVAPDEADFTPVFRFGHGLFVSTKVNNAATGLFLLDTGAQLVNIDSTFAKLSTKLSGQDHLIVHGISGRVSNVYEAHKANVQFGRFKQDNVGMPAFNLNNSPEHVAMRMSGIFGMPMLGMFRLMIDYRNGLVNFDYIYEEKKKK